MVFKGGGGAGTCPAGSAGAGLGSLGFLGALCRAGVGATAGAFAAGSGVGGGGGAGSGSGAASTTCTFLRCLGSESLEPGGLPRFLATSAIFLTTSVKVG